LAASWGVRTLLAAGAAAVGAGAGAVCCCCAVTPSLDAFRDEVDVLDFFLAIYAGDCGLREDVLLRPDAGDCNVDAVDADRLAAGMLNVKSSVLIWGT